MKPHFSLMFSLLFAYTELVNDLTVTVQIAFLQIVQMTTPLTDHFEETSPRMMVMLVRLQVFRQVTDTSAEQRDLHFGRTRVRCVAAVGIDHTGLLLFIHDRTLLSLFRF
jgi:hypothetical protein